MKVQLECMACVHKQAWSAARHATRNEKLIERVLREVARIYSRKKRAGSPAEYSQIVYPTVARITGVADPFAREKRAFNKLALAMVPDCCASLKRSKDKLATGAHLAVAGNIIDLGIGSGLDIHGTLANALHTPFALNKLEGLRKDLASCRRLLYVGDNAGEIVLDRLFIETIQSLYPQIDICFTVKSGPIINDAMMADAKQAGMDKVCRVIKTGNACVGAPMAHVSRQFMKELDAADVIIAKGHGNFETMSTLRARNIYFILKAKCDVVAAALGVKLGSSVLVHVKNVKRA